ncbi:MAG: flagellar biosynthetic protein FliO [Gammaproteobacteria bacterium]
MMMKTLPRLTAVCLALVSPVARAADAVSPTSGLAGVVSGLFAVLVLILFLAWGLKRFQIGASTGAIRVIAAASLGARERILLVQVGDTQLLVGVGSGGMRTLHVLDEPLSIAAGPQSDSPFAQRLRDMVGGRSQ